MSSPVLITIARFIRQLHHLVTAIKNAQDAPVFPFGTIQAHSVEGKGNERLGEGRGEGVTPERAMVPVRLSLGVRLRPIILSCAATDSKEPWSPAPVRWEHRFPVRAGQKNIRVLFFICLLSYVHLCCMVAFASGFSTVFMHALAYPFCSGLTSLFVSFNSTLSGRARKIITLRNGCVFVQTFAFDDVAVGGKIKSISARCARPNCEKRVR